MPSEPSTGGAGGTIGVSGWYSGTASAGGSRGGWTRCTGWACSVASWLARPAWPRASARAWAGS